MTRSRSVLVIVMCSVFAARPVAAQPVGTFSWQLQPDCNKVTVSVTQAGAIYTLDGYDDQCGAPQRAPLVGLATPNPDGTIGLGFHIATSPGGKTVSVESRISLATIGGPWTDSAGNSGTFVLNGSAAGSPRPVPSGAPTWGTTVAAPVGLTGLQFGVHAEVPTPGSAYGAAVFGSWGPDPPLSEGLLFGVGVSGNSRHGTGVMALSGDGAALYAESTSGAGVAAVSESGPAVSASSYGGPALLLGGGPIQVSGGIARRPVFQHVSSAANTTGNATAIDHPLLNGDPNALVLITRVWGAPSTTYVTSPVSVYYASGRWRIFTEQSTPMPLGVAFNVLVVKQ